MKRITILIFIVLAIMTGCAPDSGNVFGINSYTGQLGSTYLGAGKGTKFAVYAPKASAVYVAGSFNSFSTSANPMVRHSSGVWETVITSAQPGNTYKYYSSDFTNNWVRDPYGKSFNGSDNDNTIIIDNQYNWGDTNWTRPSKNQLVVYEMHVEDFTRGDSQAVSGNNYQGVIDKIPYLTNLGINAVELMPIQEWSGNSYSWGYNSACYFAPENSLSDSTNNGKAYQDLKELVDALHQAGIAVILDVVYNHTFEDAPMWKIDPAAYYSTDSILWGRKMDLTKAPTFRYAKENLIFWMNEFHVDGFRLDSTENMDSQSTRNLISFLRNEGYSDRYFIFEEFNPTHNTEIQSFNTSLGTAFISSWGTGYKNAVWSLVNSGASGDMGKVTYYSRDDGWNYPAEVINYHSSHDEGTLSGRHSATAQEVRVAAVHLLTALGIPMVWMGEEILNLHYGNHPLAGSGVDEANNLISWDSLRASNIDTYNFFAQLIKLRIAHPALHQNTANPDGGADTFDWNNNGSTWSDGVIGYSYKNVPGDNDFVILLNYESSAAAWDVTFPQPGTWYVMCNGTLATNTATGLSSFNLPGTTSNITVPAKTGLIFMSD